MRKSIMYPCLCGLRRDWMAVRAEECDTVTIAGMGGQTIAEILTAAPWTAQGDHLLLLQPMTMIAELRRRLYAHGYAVERETLCREDRRRYVVLSVRGGAPKREIPLSECAVSPALLRAEGAADYLEQALPAGEKGTGRHGTGRIGEQASRVPACAGAVHPICKGGTEMTTVQDILTFMEGLAPYELAESWDNVGLLCGDRAQEVTSVLCALDVTETVVQEAAERGAQLVVAHHPAIFTSVSRVTSDDTTGRVLRYAIKHDISIICMHTNADCAEGGVNDALASALFLTNVVSMEAGENGMLGRVGDLPREMQPREFALYVKECLRAGGVRFCDGGKPITRVAVGGGACGKLMDYAVAGGAQAFVIGDCSYDLMQRAQAIGLSLVDAGHFPTENPVAAVFADKITAAFPQVLTEVSERHADCIQFV